MGVALDPVLHCHGDICEAEELGIQRMARQECPLVLLADDTVVTHAVAELALLLGGRAKAALSPPGDGSKLSLGQRRAPRLHEGAHVHVGEGVGRSREARDGHHRGEPDRALASPPEFCRPAEGTAEHPWDDLVVVIGPLLPLGLELVREDNVTRA